MKILFGGALLGLAASAAGASTADAWAALHRDVTQRCVAASNLDHARVATPVGFDDTLGKVVTLVSGRQTVRGRRGVSSIATSKLCVYDQRSRRVWVAEANGWNAPAPR